MKFHPFIFLLIILLFSCGTKTSDTTTENKSNTLIYEETKADLQFQIQVNKKAFHLKDEIIVKAQVQNIGEETMEYYAGSSTCISHFNIQIISKETGRHIKQKLSDQPKECTDDIHTESLMPKETVSEEGIFLTKERVQTSFIPASSGAYDVVIQFRPKERSWEEAMEVHTQITIEGTEYDMISIEKAEQLAIQHKEVQKWMQNHSGESIAKIESNEYFVKWYDGWHKTNKEEYKSMKNGVYQEEKQVQFEDGKWHIRYVSKLGSSPHRIEITIDAKSADILSVQKFDK
ncbi:hypothetical protein [Gracilibacillus sp. YIM 98692]|uniref:hypothetical protein n=1 Tax=Gracilibacillus sp. YIM 98692 TaxID=2663532 RepID=UPI0013D10627|nr:hypothetical protein [Gracilibacillus sp. YIM 98692]